MDRMSFQSTTSSTRSQELPNSIGDLLVSEMARVVIRAFRLSGRKMQEGCAHDNGSNSQELGP